MDSGRARRARRAPACDDRRYGGGEDAGSGLCVLGSSRARPERGSGVPHHRDRRSARDTHGAPTPEKASPEAFRKNLSRLRPWTASALFSAFSWASSSSGRWVPEGRASGRAIGRPPSSKPWQTWGVAVFSVVFTIGWSLKRCSPLSQVVTRAVPRTPFHA
jgi:hypothetical protein